MNQNKFKILILGPKKSGKSNVANILSGHKDTPTANYKPTVALRIQEVERNGIKEDEASEEEDVYVQLWDTSGNRSFQSCWTAIEKDIDGIIFVYNPYENQEKELEFWYRAFASGRIEDRCCAIFAHKSSGSTQHEQSKRYGIPKSLSHIPVYDTSLGTHVDDMFEGFDKLLKNILFSRNKGNYEMLENSLKSISNRSANQTQ
eukprot:gb/GECH01014951.1/.p1 GENE.gb/GECH01014951.1/~~gb/GECH01014951.1/.p1  ORF type:complete len:203 (+),score=51.56 gb/GECH01014951.1/:1-609(+)